MTDQCRWGILSTAEIAQKNWRSIWNAENATLSAVASRDRGRADDFVRKFQREAAFHPLPKAYGSYAELLADPFVDAVYNPLPTALRKPWAIRTAEAGKHVLLEKPCGCNAAEVEEIVAACDAHGVQFMDGVMMMHSDRLRRMRDVIDAGKLGELKRISAHVTFHPQDRFFTENIRTQADLEPLGALGDLGWYCIRIALWAVEWQAPLRVAGRMITSTDPKDGSEPVPLEFSGELFFDGGISASFYCSFLTDVQEWVSIGGTRGSLFLDDFMLPERGDHIDFEFYDPVFEVEGTRFEMDLHKRNYSVKENGSGTKNAQETNMIRKFSELVLSNTREPQWGEYALLTQRVLDGCLKSARRDGVLVPL